LLAITIQRAGLGVHAYDCADPLAKVLAGNATRAGSLDCGMSSAIAAGKKNGEVIAGASVCVPP